MGSDQPWTFMRDIEARTGAFMPRLAVEAMRESGDHMLADMIEGMADRIDYLERRVALLTPSVRLNPRKRK